MKLQPGDLVRPDGHWPPNSRLGGIELALVVGVRRPELAVMPDSSLQKVEK